MNPIGHPVKVVLVEDHRMFREWLGHMVAATGDFTVVGEADNIADALDLIEKNRPDIAIVDLTLRGSSGLELIKNLKARALNIPVLVLSMHDEELYAERVLKAGAKGYVCKHEASATVTTAIRKILGGEIYLNEKMTARMLGTIGRSSPRASSGLESLADRELEVFQLIGKGYNIPRIAEQLHLGETTIGTYRARIKEKLQVKTSAELYTRAAQWVQERGV